MCNSNVQTSYEMYNYLPQYKNCITFYFLKFVRVKTSLKMLYLYNLNIYV